MIFEKLQAVFTLPHVRAATINLSFDNPTATADPAHAVLNLYNFGLGIAGLLAFGVIVYAAVKYTFAAGNPSAQSDAKDRIANAFLGLLLLLGAAFLLGIIDPNLKTLTNPDIAQLSAPNLQPLGAAPGESGGGLGVGRCQSLTAGPASADNLIHYCWDNGESSQQASAIANIESNGGVADAKSGSDICLGGGKTVSVSRGLFQINLSANKIYRVSGVDVAGIPDSAWSGNAFTKAIGYTGYLDCPSAFSDHGGFSSSNANNCQVNDDPQSQQLFQWCVLAANDPVVNTVNACNIFQSQSLVYRWSGPRSETSKWGANAYCHFP